jgi:hypothetical protein
VRILAVVGDELTGVDEGRDWAVLEALVAANGPNSIEVHVLAVVNRHRGSMLFGMPLGKAVGRTSAPAAGAGYDPGESARQRLDRALRYLRGLGLHADGDLGVGDAYRATRQELARGGYDRVLLLLNQRSSWLARLTGRSPEARLRRSVSIPVDALGRSEIVPPER